MFRQFKLNDYWRYLLASLAIAVPVTALADSLSFDFGWKNFKNQNRHLAISVNREALEFAYRNPKEFTTLAQYFGMLGHYAGIYARNISQHDSSVSVITSNQSPWLKVEGRFVDGKRYDNILKQKEVLRYLQSFVYDSSENSYYIYDVSSGYVSINYSSVIKDFGSVFKRLDSGLSAYDARQDGLGVINERLAFLQSVKYSLVEDQRLGFLNPIMMISEGKGDCETKQIILAGLLKVKFPNASVYLVTFPEKNHIIALIRADHVSEHISDFALNIDGKPYYIMDATGPGRVRVEDGAMLAKEFSFFSTKKIWSAIGE